MASLSLSLSLPMTTAVLKLSLLLLVPLQLPAADWHYSRHTVLVYGSVPTHTAWGHVRFSAPAKD